MGGGPRAPVHKQDLISRIRYVWESNTKQLTCPLDKEVQVSSLCCRDILLLILACFCSSAGMSSPLRGTGTSTSTSLTFSLNPSHTDRNRHTSVQYCVTPITVTETRTLTSSHREVRDRSETAMFYFFYTVYSGTFSQGAQTFLSLASGVTARCGRCITALEHSGSKVREMKPRAQNLPLCRQIFLMQLDYEWK